MIESDVAGYHVRGLVHGLTALGLDPELLMRAAGIEPESLGDPEVRVPEMRLLALWLSAERAHGEATFGLTLAQQIPYGKLELIDYVVGSCATLRDGLESLACHARLCASGFRYRFEFSDEGSGSGLRLHLEHRLGNAMLPRSLVEYFWALLILRFRAQCGHAFRPTLRLRQGPSGPARTYREALGVTPECAEEASLWIPGPQLELINPRQDAALAALLRAHARDVSSRLADEDLESRLRGAVVQALHRGDPRLPQVSRRLGLSARSLQRRLASDDRSFAQLVDSVRYELALEYLARSQLSLAEISGLLAYADPSAFGRAFRRWTGTSPHHFRLGRTPEADATMWSPPLQLT